MFGDGSVKAQLDWSLVTDADFRVAESFSRSPGDLGRKLTVWYLDPAGRPVDWYTAGARPLTVREAAHSLSHWDAGRAARIARFQKGFAAQGEPVRLVLPCLAVSRGAELILDGSHRAVAAYAAQIPLTVFGYALHGPMSVDLLPDLRHYA